MSYTKQNITCSFKNPLPQSYVYSLGMTLFTAMQYGMEENQVKLHVIGLRVLSALYNLKTLVSMVQSKRFCDFLT